MGVALLLAAATAAAPPAAWETLAPGLELGTFAGPAAPGGDRKIHVLRIDPKRFDLQLASASVPGGGKPQSAKAWAKQSKAVAAINAGMFQPGGKGVSMLRAPGRVSNGRLTKDKAVLAFAPKRPGLPAVRLLDRECDDAAAILEDYDGAAQSVRMLSCKGTNVWAAQPKRWSAAAVGQDAQGRLLFLHVRTAYTMHELVDALVALPLGLARLMYVEGGPLAQLYVGAAGREQSFVGSYETGFHELDDNAGAWPIPNVLVVVPKATAGGPQRGGRSKNGRRRGAAE